MKVVVIASLHERGRKLLEDSFHVEYGGWAIHEPVVTPLPSDEEIIQMAADAQAIIVPGELSSEVIEACPHLRVIGVARGDPRGVDLDTATRHGIKVVYAAGRNANAVADLTMAFAIMLLRELPKAQQFVTNGEWKTWDDLFATSLIEGKELWGRTIGLIGFGSIGELVTKRAKAFDMQVVVYDPYVDKERIGALGGKTADLKNLMAESDIVSIHCKLTEETKSMLGDEQLGWMKPGAYLINTARAAVIDQQALLRTLQSGRLGGAAFDVYWEEPLPLNHPLLHFPNVILTPHIGGATEEVEVRTAEMVAQDVLNVLMGKQPNHLANPQVYSEG